MSLDDSAQLQLRQYVARQRERFLREKASAPLRSDPPTPTPTPPPRPRIVHVTREYLLERPCSPLAQHHTLATDPWIEQTAREIAQKAIRMREQKAPSPPKKEKKNKRKTAPPITIEDDDDNNPLPPAKAPRRVSEYAKHARTATPPPPAPLPPPSLSIARLAHDSKRGVSGFRRSGVTFSAKKPAAPPPPEGEVGKAWKSLFGANGHRPDPPPVVRPAVSSSSSSSSDSDFASDREDADYLPRQAPPPSPPPRLSPPPPVVPEAPQQPVVVIPPPPPPPPLPTNNNNGPSSPAPKTTTIDLFEEIRAFLSQPLRQPGGCADPATNATPWDTITFGVNVKYTLHRFFQGDGTLFHVDEICPLLCFPNNNALRVRISLYTHKDRVVNEGTVLVTAATNLALFQAGLTQRADTKRRMLFPLSLLLRLVELRLPHIRKNRVRLGFQGE